tara:strand:+ start:83 stop:925 length:843 start_codon:yes stop_codon:yes gene_type:complete
MSEEIEEVQEPAAPAPSMGTVDQTEESSWRTSLPEELRDNASLQKYSTVESLAKGYVNASSMLGRDKLVMPNSDDEWADMYSKLGRPEDATGYKFDEVTMPDGFALDENQLNDFQEKAHSVGLSEKQANELYGWYVGNQSTQFEGMVNSAEEQLIAAQTDLRKAWGNAYDQKFSAAERAVREFGGEELEQALAETGAGNNPMLIKAFAQIGEKLMGDTSLEGGQQHAKTPDMIKEEISKIQNNPAFYDKDNLERPAMVRRMQGLMEEMHGTDVVGGYAVG